LETLSVDGLRMAATSFASEISSRHVEELVGVTDGKAVGNYLENHFKSYLKGIYDAEDWGNAAKGIDLPTINTDIKFTSERQPQSSLPYKDSKQKIFGLGYNLIVFIYRKDDGLDLNIGFSSVVYIDQERTADFSLTRMIRQSLNADANFEDIYALLKDRNIPGDDITYDQIVNEIMVHSPKQGYLTISNALQWRAQYSRIESVAGTVVGIDKLYG